MPERHRRGRRIRSRTLQKPKRTRQEKSVTSPSRSSDSTKTSPSFRRILLIVSSWVSFSATRSARQHFPARFGDHWQPKSLREPHGGGPAPNPTRDKRSFLVLQLPFSSTLPEYFWYTLATQKTGQLMPACVA